MKAAWLVLVWLILPALAMASVHNEERPFAYLPQSVANVAPIRLASSVSGVGAAANKPSDAVKNQQPDSTQGSKAIVSPRDAKGIVSPRDSKAGIIGPVDAKASKGKSVEVQKIKPGAKSAAPAAKSLSPGSAVQLNPQPLPPAGGNANTR